MALSQFCSCLSDITHFTHFTPDVVHQPTVLTCVMSFDGVLTACFVTGELDLAVPHLVTGDTVATVVTVVTRWSRIPATARSSPTAASSTSSPTTTRFAQTSYHQSLHGALSNVGTPSTAPLPHRVPRHAFRISGGPHPHHTNVFVH